jgi:hypothetical protein
VPRQEELRLGPGAVELAPGEARPQGPCQTLPHLEQRTFRPVGGITAAVSKRVLQAGQIMTVIV